METSYGNKIGYRIAHGADHVDLSTLVGKDLRLTYSGKIICSSCAKSIKKVYAEGVCYNCTMKLASCDLCIMKPETCHYHLGTCREPQWGLDHCFQPHVVYLANSSGLKVGITRRKNVPYRWIDQGASEALAILEVSSRLLSGQIEVLFKKHINDKTDWRKMLKGEPDSIDLVEWKGKLLSLVQEELKSFTYAILDEPVVKINYPVDKYPEKVTSFNLDKVSEINGRLIGIKGQYLIFDTGVFNVRSHAGYQVTLEEIHAKA